MRKDIIDKKNEIIEWIDSQRSKAEICRELNCKPETLDKYLTFFGIKYKGQKNKKGQKKGGYKYIPVNEYLKRDYIDPGKLKIKLLKEGYLAEKCSCCGITEWNNKKIIFELHHIDGNNTNNNISNLEMICPNCHSQTENFRGRNTQNNNKIDKDELKNLLLSGISIKQALLKVGLTPKGANYEKAYDLIFN